MEKKMGQKNGQEKRQKTKAEYKNVSREELMQEISGQENARTEEEKEARKNAYHAYVSQVTPSYSLTLNMLKAFLVGGIICCIGQGIMNFAMSRGLDQMNAGKWTSVILVLISVILTGLNIYPTIAKFGGAGALVPITGFANGVAAPAIEFKKRGAGLWYRQSDFFHRWSGHFVWYFYQLAVGTGVLDLEIGIVKLCWIFSQKYTIMLKG